MNNRPSLDFQLLIPIVVGGCSILGILVVFIVGRFLNAPGQIDATPSSTPFQYIYLGTEPGITTPVIEGSDIPVTEAPTEEATPGFVPPTGSTRGVPTVLVLSSPTRRATSNATPGTATATRAVTATRTSTASAGNTYDDTDNRLQYSGSWVTETGLNGPYQGTLHISSSTGNSVTFTFTGFEIHFFYQPGASLGTVTVSFDADTLNFPVNEAQGNGEWSKTLDTGGTHTVTITHTGGGSVNIDRLLIPTSGTTTPTRTPTPTSTQP